MAKYYEDKEKTTVFKVNTSITCNCCGKTTLRDFNGRYEEYEEGLWNGKYQSFKFDWGYMSNYDTEQWSFDLCQECLKDIVSNFKIPVDVKDYT